MVDKSELRLGNWVTNFLGEYFQVNTATMLYYPFPEPIPLTHEILTENADFDFDGANSLYHKFGCSLEYKDGKYLFFLAHIKHGYKEIKYLHRLQNLIYELTDKELEIKL